MSRAVAEPIHPEYRLRNVRRELKNLLLGRRLAADPERTGVVELADFGKRCDALADFAAQSLSELAAVGGEEAACARRAVEEVELAARLAARMETLPRSAARLDRQCRLLEEALGGLEAALQAECLLEEPPVWLSLSTLARQERDLFAPFVDFEGRLEEAPAGLVERGAVRRALRRALLAHAAGPFTLSVSKDGVLRFADLAYETEAAPGGLARSPREPPEVKKALDLREAAPDPALRDFLLVKAVDEALCALLAPRLHGHELAERARALPRRPGKRTAIRPEAVQRDVAGWDVKEAVRAAEKLAARRLGPEWARLPKGAYPLRLFVSENDELAADLLVLGPALRRMERGEVVEGSGPRAERALRGLLGLLG
ncbi:MAG: hypothetical protein ACYTEZ_17960 [Planctomycetota bacterium]